VKIDFMLWMIDIEGGPQQDPCITDWMCCKSDKALHSFIAQSELNNYIEQLKYLTTNPVVAKVLSHVDVSPEKPGNKWYEESQE
jgi:hypothetical protein